ncbi:MAG: PAS domain S-box protein [Terracidiphilus sp.]|jgi:diguanylate cyclase (GGDEF)-like protein/PAS domain S-box-containing protein
MPGYRMQASVDAEAPGPGSNPTFCFLLDEAPRLVSIRGDSETLLGIGQRTLLSGKVQFKDLIHPDDAAVAARIFSSDLEPRSGVFNIRIRHADGRIRCFKGHYVKKPSRGPGRALLHLSIADARTMREPGDDILLVGFKSLVEHATDYLYLKNRNHVILAASKYLPNLTDATKDRYDLVGKTDYDILPEGIADIGYRLESRALAEGRRVSKIQPLPSPDGTKRWVDDRKYPIMGPNGEMVGIFGIGTEITHYIETEQELRHNVESLREAQDTAGLCTYVVDLPGKVWHLSPGLESLLGLDPGEGRVYEEVSQLIHPDDRARVDDHFGNGLRGDRKVLDGECRIIRSNDKALRWLHVYGRLEHGADGNPVALRGTVQDITGQKQIETALRENKELLQLFVDHAPVPLAMLDREMRYLAVSQRWREAYGLNDRELIGHSHYEIFPDLSEDWKAQHRQALEGKVVPRCEGWLKRPGVSPQWLSRELRPWLTADGQVGGIVIFSEDITEQKETEAALRERESSLREAQEIARLGSFVLDIPTQVWKTSPELEALLGIDAGYDRTLEGFWPLIHPDDRAVVEKRFRGYLRGKGRTFEGEYRIVRWNDRQVRWIRVHSKLELDAQGKPLSLRGTIQDVTEMQQANLALRESKELLELFTEHAPANLIMLDREMRYIAVSRRFLETESLVGQEIIGRSHYEVISLAPEAWKADHRRVLAGETVHPEDDILPVAGGGKRWLRREIRPWRMADGEVGGIVIFSEDITEQKKAESVLRASKELLQLFIEQAPVALAMFDREMRYLAVSCRWLEEERLRFSDIIGRSHYEVFPNTPESWKELHRRVLAGEAIPASDVIAQRADGSRQWLRREIRPWYAGDGSVGGIIIFAENIMEQKRADAELRESKELLRLFIGQAPVALAMFDTEMRYLATSQRWLDMLKLTENEILGRSHYDILPGIPESWKEEHRRALAGEAVRTEESRIEGADGKEAWYRREILPWRAGDGSIGGILVFAEDITKRKEAEDRLRLAASVFTGAREGIVITDSTGAILEVNEAFTQITGYTREEVLGRNPKLFNTGLQSKEFYDDLLDTLVREGHWSGELWNRTKNGDVLAEMLTINAIHDANGEVVQYVGLFTDITQIKEHEKQLERIAHYDALTGLPNRALFADRLRQAMAHARRTKKLLAVAYFDIDGFKAVNDRYGHLTGDVLLTALAFRMKRVLREGDTLARLGGDEFAAVILDIDDASACSATLNRLLASAAEEAQIGEIMLRVSASAGVAFYPQTEDVDADVLLRQAGQAMYQAKLAGRKRISVFDPNQDQLVRGRHENIEHIREALAAKQFVLYYQPKVNMRTGKVIGAEALIRWQHPERGLLPPGMFLPVIEDHPLAVDLGDWVLESALTQMESWQAEGFDLPVSVNVGATELQQPGFADRLRARLAAHPKVKPASLELEVVETSAMQDVVRTSQVLSACRELGVSIGLDDFGTGYSSLTYLKRLPANILKIDQSFVRDMLEEPENLTILEGVLGLAAAFHRQVIAEGVETAEHGLMLLQMGCDLAQGYGIARPMPAGRVLAWAAAWKPDPLWAEVPAVHDDNRAALYASVEHRAWLGAFEAFLAGKRATPPTLDICECRLGAWLDAQAHSARRSSPAIQALDTLHRQFHSLASEILGSQADVQRSDGLNRLRELHHLHEKCRKRLIPLARASSGKSGENGSRNYSKQPAGAGTPWRINS